MDIDVVKLASQNQMLRRKCQHLEGDAQRLEAERDRLREALEAIAIYEPGSKYIGEEAVRLKQLARRALEGSE